MRELYRYRGVSDIYVMMSDMTDEGMPGRRVVPVSFVDVAVLGPVLFPWGSRRWRSRGLSHCY